MAELHVLPRLLIDRLPSGVKIMLDCPQCRLFLVGAGRERIVSLETFKAEWPGSAARWGDFLALVGKEVLNEAVHTAATRKYRKRLPNSGLQKEIVERTPA
jgi:hypothetical protein